MQPTLAVVYYSSRRGPEEIGYLMSMIPWGGGGGVKKFQVPLENKKVKFRSHELWPIFSFLPLPRCHSPWFLTILLLTLSPFLPAGLFLCPLLKV